MKGLPTNTLFYRKPTNLFLSRRSQNIQKSNYSAMQIDTRFFSTSVKGCTVSPLCSTRILPASIFLTCKAFDTA